MTNHEIQLAHARGRTLRLNGLGLNRRGKPLVHRKWRGLDRLGLTGKAREAMRRKLVRRENKRSGLTVRGTSRINRQWPSLRGKTKTERHTIWHRDFIAKRYARGLTARGTVPMASILPPAESAWRMFREKDVVATLERTAA